MKRYFLNVEFYFRPLLLPMVILAKIINIVVPKPIEPIEAVRIKSAEHNSAILNRAIKFSKRYPPNYVPLEQRLEEMKQGGSEKVGGVNSGRIAVNLVGDLIKTKDAKAKLLNAGFEIVKVYHINKRRSLVSIVFTNSELKRMASKDGRGFAGTLRLLIDKKDKIYAITNPLYITKAFSAR